MTQSGSQLGFFKTLGVIAITSENFIGTFATQRDRDVLARETRQQHGR